VGVLTLLLSVAIFVFGDLNGCEPATKVSLARFERSIASDGRNGGWSLDLAMTVRNDSQHDVRLESANVRVTRGEPPRHSGETNMLVDQALRSSGESRTSFSAPAWGRS
jgi:hypothetical protein